MKKIFFLFLISSAIFSQNDTTEKLFTLKSLIAKEVTCNQIYSVANQSFSLRSDDNLVDIKKDKKNPTLAILYSVLIPGLGELYANNYKSGKYFTIADGILWGLFAGFNIYGNWKEDNYKTFAQLKGGVNLSGKDSDYFATIGIYISVEEYNRVKELNREFFKVYNPRTDFWKWENENQRREYRQLWLSSEQAYNNVRFAIGALILNRIISAINAVRLVNAYNKNILDESEFNINIGVINQLNLPTQITINLLKRF